jgi:hypothetical protein
MKKGLVVRGKSAPRPFEKLPKKQQEFVRRYVQTADVELAYIEAGFIGSDRSRMGNARKLLNALRPYIAAATKEYVTGVAGQPMEVAAIYEVSPQGIIKVWFVSAT